MKMTDLWDTALCSLVEVDRRFRGAEDEMGRTGSSRHGSDEKRLRGRDRKAVHGNMVRNRRIILK
jgi:hypothetical protein